MDVAVGRGSDDVGATAVTVFRSAVVSEGIPVWAEVRVVENSRTTNMNPKPRKPLTSGECEK